jgi:hypothetical protein
MKKTEGRKSRDTVPLKDFWSTEIVVWVHTSERLSYIVLCIRIRKYLYFLSGTEEPGGFEPVPELYFNLSKNRPEK